MKIAYLDCFAGVSGDMVLGALLDLGLDKEALESVLADLRLGPFSIEANRVTRNGIGAMDVKISVKKQQKHRHLKDIFDSINSGKLSDSVRERSKLVFQRIAEAESTVHRMPVERVHFHEVGAVDSIIDIIGSVWGLEQLGISQCYCSAISLGSGTVKCDHGIIPVPAPATLELVKGFPVVKKEAGTELTTPTGAALVTTVAKHVETIPEFRIVATGCGAGDKEFDSFPNIFRILMGEVKSSYEQDNLLVLETNVDDMNPELYPYIMDKLIAKGAADVFLTPVIMKKGRPGHMITILLKHELIDECLTIIFRETTSLGVRLFETGRRKLKRDIVSLHTPWGKLHAKSYVFNGDKHVVPEYDECKKIAERENIPLNTVYDTVKRIGNPDD